MMRLQLLAAWGLLLCACFAFGEECRADPPISFEELGGNQVFADVEHDPLQKKLFTADAHKDNSKRTARTAQTSKSGGSLVKSVLALAFVLCLILVGTAWTKKHFPQANKTLPTEAVQPLGQRSIGGRQLIQLVRCGSRILILGSTPQGLTTLGEVTDPVEVDYLAGLCRQEQPHSVTSAFAQLFQNYREADAENESATKPLRSISEKLGWFRSADGPQETPVQTPAQESFSRTPERTLKERLGRLGADGAAASGSAKEQTHG